MTIKSLAESEPGPCILGRDSFRAMVEVRTIRVAGIRLAHRPNSQRPGPRLVERRDHPGGQRRSQLVH